MQFDPQTAPAGAVSKILTGSVIPRPIAWVSTVSAEGVLNLAPFSFFNVAAHKPPTLLFCIEVRGSDGGIKDTYHNIVATKQYVINIATEPLAEAMNLSSTELPPERDEFEVAGLTPAPSARVTPPRVAASPVSFECELRQVVPIGDGTPGSAWIMIGEVVYVHVADEIINEKFYVDSQKLRAIGRLSGFGYSRTTDTFEMKRPPSQLGSTS
ncbi:MAG: flavin reductase family protein [Anaerolineales bacterium]|nr:flavin reductase family protein [Anaerolineales bacterium]